MIEALGQQLLQGAMTAGSSDLYILPREDAYVVYEHGIDGLMMIQSLPKETGVQLIAHFKYRADMAITETRRPQLGAMKVQLNGTEIHLRLSSVGNFLQQESLVIRLLFPLGQQQTQFLVPEQWTTLEEWCGLRGLILFAGPTGSGKTTTIFQLARPLSQQQSVLTIEDPVEITESSFLQLQVNNEADMSYESLIKVALRHRPDVLIIGEIRDRQTAQAAIDAVLSGHLVFSTVHALNVYGIITRLRQLGIPEAAIHQAVTGVAYQRLLPGIEMKTAALLDLKRGPVTSDWVTKTGMTPEWRQYIDDCERTGQITGTTADRFKEG
ncbi:competence type IV pilus ATPase ComGA [Secundilactobacillus paracollinoides]|uniref:Bacterial type II secretion system protein E domain-containing protein n=1 Tax=Secundilactobacillus paracollinoides TaxID=240427 RepID=A0A1B2J1W0_9LACO|nr:competence type IV pilus ATPase ComGA [Secundilactobacillus paracollinoides]ANZ62279.1 hypothetical protein AYR61_13705 [Secundilactobacillus paracollinoides]ANZ68228.1 hypothetical protein AYR63_14580 [Secundilactobacillus paracollinoides]